MWMWKKFLDLTKPSKIICIKKTREDLKIVKKQTLNDSNPENLYYFTHCQLKNSIKFKKKPMKHKIFFIFQFNTMNFPFFTFE